MSTANRLFGTVNGHRITLPTRWAICPTCEGNGSHSQAIGAITGQEWLDDWSPEEREDSLNGAYDRHGETCDGSGKVLEVNRRACNTRELRAALKDHDEGEEHLAEVDAIQRAEIAFGC